MNSRTEGSVGAFKKGTLLDHGLSNNQSMQTFVAAAFINVQAHSKEHRDKLLVSVDGVGSFQKLPCPDRECWMSINRLHPFAMALIDTKVLKPAWDDGMAKHIMVTKQLLMNSCLALRPARFLSLVWLEDSWFLQRSLTGGERLLQWVE